MFICLFVAADIDVQLVNLVKALVNPVNITVEAAAVKDGKASQVTPKC